MYYILEVYGTYGIGTQCYSKRVICILPLLSGTAPSGMQYANIKVVSSSAETVCVVLQLNWSASRSTTSLYTVGS